VEKKVLGNTEDTLEKESKMKKKNCVQLREYSDVSSEELIENDENFIRVMLNKKWIEDPHHDKG
jgi:hypothetical protein